MGWSQNLHGFLTLVREIRVWHHLRGFALNVANMQPLGQAACDPSLFSSAASESPAALRSACSGPAAPGCCADPCHVLQDWGYGNSELNYAMALHLASRQVMPSFRPRMVIDTARNGGAFASCDQWCNVREAAIGRPPTKLTDLPEVVDAYLWVKPPGDSDGCSDPSCARFDRACAAHSSLGSSDRGFDPSSSALAPWAFDQPWEPYAPEAGVLWPYQLVNLARAFLPPPPPLAPPSSTPPASPMPALNRLTLVPRQAAMASSTYSTEYAADHAIDGDMTTAFVSRSGAGNWLSVQVPLSARIGYVAVHNVLNPTYASYLGRFEVWSSAGAGEVSGYKCGEDEHTDGRAVPFVFWCGGDRHGGFVTLKQKGGARILPIAELEVYDATPPVPPLAALTMASRQAATASSTYSTEYQAANAIDGDTAGVPFVSTSSEGNWLSVQVQSGTRIGFVAVYNMLDAAFATWLGSFEVWLGSSFGDMAVLCGEAAYATGQTKPHMLWCGSEGEGISYRYVTVKQTGTARMLAVTELEIYDAPAQPPEPPLRPPTPPVPPLVPPPSQSPCSPTSTPPVSPPCFSPPLLHPPHPAISPPMSPPAPPLLPPPLHAQPPLLLPPTCPHPSPLLSPKWLSPRTPCTPFSPPSHPSPVRPALFGPPLPRHQSMLSRPIVQGVVAMLTVVGLVLAATPNSVRRFVRSMGTHPSIRFIQMVDTKVDTARPAASEVLSSTTGSHGLPEPAS